MRKIYLLGLTLMLGIVVNAQVNLPHVNPTSVSQPYVSSIGKGLNNKTATCMDTIRYPHGKLTGMLEADTMDYATYISGTSQVFYLSGAGTISGITTLMMTDFDLVPGNGPTVSLVIGVYDIDVNNKPTTAIQTDTVMLSDMGLAEQALMFSTPVAVSDSFAITIQLDTMNPSNPYYITNTSANGDGQAENLSAIEYLGVWYAAYTEMLGWDMDIMVAPIFQQDITSAYTTSADTVACGDNVVFTNGSTYLSDYMFNRYDSVGMSMYEWNFGDGTGDYYPMDTTYAYPTSGVYNTQLSMYNYGYTTTCVDSSQHQITVAIFNSAATAICDGDSIMIGGTYQFAAGTFIDSLTSVSGCDSIVSMTLSINPVYHDSVDTFICEGDSIMLGGSMQDSSGVFMDTLSTINGCDSIVTTFLSVHGDSTVTANFFATTPSGGTTIQFHNQSTGADSYMWYFGDGNTSTAVNPLYTYAPDSSYTACLVATTVGACGVDSTCKTVVTVIGVDELSSSDEVSIYPVPVNNYFNVTVPAKYMGGEIIINDVVGKQLKMVRINDQKQIKIATTGFASGIYFVSIEHEGKRVLTRRIAVDK